MPRQSDDGISPWAKLAIAATIASAAVPAQYWLGKALANGDFGRAPDWAVFGPLVLWIIADIFIATLAARAVRSRPRLAIAYLVVLAICLVGTYLAKSAVTSFLRIV